MPCGVICADEKFDFPYSLFGALVNDKPALSSSKKKPKNFDN
jgi:hypothetical protein